MSDESKKELRIREGDPATVALPAGTEAVTYWSEDGGADAAVLLARLANELPHVRALELYTSKKSDGAPFPVGMGALRELERIELGDFAGPLPEDLGACTRVTELQVRSNDPSRVAEDVARLLPRVRALTLIVTSEGEHDVPQALASLGSLESLDLYFTVKDARVLGSIPTLKKLSARGFADSQLPEGVCDAAGLEELSISGHINTLPASISKLTRLKKLDLSRALNKGALVSRFDAITQLKPLPKALASLVNLEELMLDHCGVLDVEVLRPLTRLRVLTLSWSPLTTLDDIAALSTLEELSLEHVDRVKDFAPLARLTKLRKLNIEDTRPKDLEFLRSLPALRELNLSSVQTKNMRAVFDVDVQLEADKEVLERYEQRAALRKLPPIASIVGELGRSDLATVERALESLAAWTIACSSRDANAIFAAFGAAPLPDANASDDDDDDHDDHDHDDDDHDDDDHDDDDDDDDDDGDEDAGGAAPARAAPTSVLAPLDACLATHAKRVNPTVLASLFGALFQRMEEDHPAALVAAREVASRGDDAAQLALVDAWRNAGEYYDSGHRMWEATVQDVMIEEVLPALRGPALAALVKTTANDAFTSDGMEPLWVPALTLASAAEHDVLYKRLNDYLEYATQYREAKELDDLWRALDGVVAQPGAGIVRALKDQLAAKTALARMQKELEEALEGQGGPEARRAAIARVATLEREPMGEFRGALWSATRADDLDDASIAALLTIWRDLDDEHGLAGALVHVAPRGVAAANAFVAPLALPREMLSKALRMAISDELRAEATRRLRAGWDRSMSNRESDPASAPLPAPLPDLPRLNALRAWANDVDGCDALDGGRRDLDQAFTRVGHFEREQTRLVIDLLAATELPRDYAIADKAASGLAGDIGMTADEEDGWPHLRLFARHLGRLGMRGKSLERILAQLLGVGLRTRDNDAVATVLALVPDVVTWDILSYNLACHYAVTKQREQMLKHVKRSLALGKSPTQFAADDDFASYRDDPDYLALMKTVE